jgi:anaerobic magnesium-protoporphyrin IX monomethyl ester cyclase
MIILVAPTSECSRPNLSKQGALFFPPQGILLVSQVVANAGHNVLFFDGNDDDPDYLSTLRQAITKHKKEITYIGFYLTFLSVPDGIKIMKLIRSLDVKIPIVAGGPIVSLFYTTILESGFVDYCCTGDGAEMAAKLADQLSGKKDLDKVPNLAFINNGEIQISPLKCQDHLDKSNVIHYEQFIDLERYTDNALIYLPKREEHPEIKRAIGLLTGLGCSYKCAFCQNAISGRKHQSLSAEEIVARMRYYRDNFQIDTFGLFDEEFFSDKARLFQFLDLYEKENLGVKWATATRASVFGEQYVNKSLVERLEKNGCIRLILGIESGSPKILKQIKKGITPEMALNAARIAADSTIEMSYSFIVSLPGETREDIALSMQLADKLVAIKKNSYVSGIHEYAAYPGTPLTQGDKSFDNYTFEDFQNLHSITQYNRGLNIERDMVKELMISHFRSRHEFNWNQGFLRKVLNRGFNIIGDVRQLLDFYQFPFELQLKNMYFNHR